MNRVFLPALLLAATILSAKPAPEPASTLEALARWQAWRFGLFIHWGPVSLKGTEIGWSRGGQIPREEYDQLYKQFNPTLFNAEEWAKTAKDAGMKYLVITAKHVDGFCLWPSKFTDYHIGNTPFKRDVLKELSDACKKHGVQFCAYYAITDWYHPDYPLGSPGGQSRKSNPNMARYIEYVKNQTRELIENYGPLGVLWFDTGDAQVWTPEYGHYGEELYRHVKQLQPSILTNDRVYIGRQHHTGDFSTVQYEGRVGGFNRGRPWETCTVMGGHWAWCPYAEKNFMSLPEAVRMLLRIAGNDGNFLLNVGPRADGRIEPGQAARLKEVGGWLAKHGGIQGTRGGPFKAGRWGVSLCKDNTIRLFIMQWPEEGPLRLPAMPAKITANRTLSGGQAEVRQDKDGVAISLPAADRDPIAAVVELTVEGRAFDIPPVTVPSFAQMRARIASKARTPELAQGLKKGRLGLWHLDEGEGATAGDSSSNGLNGAITGAPKWEEGRFGKALTGGQGAGVVLSSAPIVKKEMSMAAWIKASEAGQLRGQNVMGNRDAFGFSLDGSYFMFWAKGADGKQYAHTPAEAFLFTFDAWHHLAMTHDGAVMRLYLDGKELNDGTKAQFVFKDSDKPFQFGLDFQGAMDEMMLYDRALSREEVEALATADKAED